MCERVRGNFIELNIPNARRNNSIRRNEKCNKVYKSAVESWDYMWKFSMMKFNGENKIKLWRVRHLSERKWITVAASIKGKKSALRLLQHIVFIAVNSYYLLSAMLRTVHARTWKGRKGDGRQKMVKTVQNMNWRTVQP